MMVKESMKNAKERRPTTPTSSDAGEAQSSDYERDFEAFDMRCNILLITSFLFMYLSVLDYRDFDCAERMFGCICCASS